MNIYAQAGLTVVSKQAGAFRVHSTFRTCSPSLTVLKASGICMLCAQDKEKPLKDLQIAGLERQLRLASVEQQVCQR